jgi:flagellar biosynthesis protein FliR
MNQLLEQFTEQHIVAFFLTLGRIAPLFVIAPLFSSKMIPARARGVAAVAIAIGFSPMAAKEAKFATDGMTIGGLMLKEILVGIAFAFTIQCLFAAVSAAGSLLDTSIGFSFGSLIDPINNQQSGVLTQVYSLIGVMIFVVIGGDAWVIRGLAETYDVIPLDATPKLGALTAGVQGAFAHILVAAIEVAAPVLLAVIITDAAFGVVSRVMPQLNVFAVGFPAKILVGFLLIGTSLPFVANWIGDQLTESVGAALKTLQVA